MGAKKSETQPTEVQSIGTHMFSSETIANRAYEIHLSGTGGDDLENWFRAERELQEEMPGEQEPVHAPGIQVAA